MGEAKIIDGKAIAEKIHERTAAQTRELKEKHGLQPGLAVILVGEDPASKIYVGMKAKKCAELGLFSDKRVLPTNATQEEVLALVRELNADPKIHGILAQSPPPPHIDEEQVILAIRPEKDVDCFHPANVGNMLIGKTDGFFPCTPYGVMKLLEYSGVDPAGKHAVILGRSNIVGKPMMALLVQKAKGANATVTVCHSRTADIPSITRQADILIAAIGKPEFVTSDMIKDGAVVIDVGINRVEAPAAAKGYRVVGDAHFESLKAKASLITPVPGGVGPMTIAMLMSNAVKACAAQHKIKLTT